MSAVEGVETALVELQRAIGDDAQASAIPYPRIRWVEMANDIFNDVSDLLDYRPAAVPLEVHHICSDMSNLASIAESHGARGVCTALTVLKWRVHELVREDGMDVQKLW